MLGLKPWWQTRRAWGFIVGAGAAIFDLSIDTEQTTEIIIRIVELAGLITTWWGGIAAKAEVDKTLIAPGIRIPLKDKQKPLDPDSSDNTPHPLTNSVGVQERKANSDVDKALGHFSSN